MGLQTGEVRVIQLMDLMEEPSNHTEANQNTTARNTYFQLSYRINFPHPLTSLFRGGQYSARDVALIIPYFLPGLVH